MKRVLIGFVAAAALYFLGGLVVRALASDETKIRWRVESMIDGFNRERASPILRGFAQEFRDDTSEADRELVHQAVVSLFFRERDPQTKRFLLRAEIDPETLVVEVSEDGSAATVNGVLTLFERKGELEDVLWSASFEGELVRGEDGFRFVRSTHETVGGERPR